MYGALQEVGGFLRNALECSLYLSPTDPGLTYQELCEAGQRGGFQNGEIADAFQQLPTRHGLGNRMLPDHHGLTLDIFLFREEPDYRNFAAFDFVLSEMNDRIRSEGGNAARVERSVLVERGVGRSLPRIDLEAAITILVLTEKFLEADGILRPASKMVYEPLPSEQRKGAIGEPKPRPARAKAYAIVKDIVERRSDGRPAQVEPLDAFGERLADLGYPHFRMWWTQTVAEFRLADAQCSPVATAVLAAALVEGALTFVVKHARSLDLPVFRSSDFERDPRTWRIDVLIASAASGSDSAVLDSTLKARAETLIRVRKRIHAGALLSEFPSGLPDLRPEEARDSKNTAELVVRGVLDWLAKYPPGATIGPA